MIAFLRSAQISSSRNVQYAEYNLQIAGLKPICCRQESFLASYIVQRTPFKDAEHPLLACLVRLNAPDF